MSAVVNGLIGGAVAVVLAAVAQRGQRSARIGADGWRLLRPSWLLHGTFFGCSAFASFITGILLSGGSSRPNADTQNLYAVALGAGFGLCALYVGWTTYGRTVAWKGKELRVRTAFGRESVRRFSDVRSIKKSESRGDYRVSFLDGSTLGFSAYLHGAQELAERLLASVCED
jgi:hypothetical protein